MRLEKKVIFLLFSLSAPGLCIAVKAQRGTFFRRGQQTLSFQSHTSPLCCALYCNSTPFTSMEMRYNTRHHL